MKHLFLLISTNFIALILYAQTNVSGGIYANTTWTLINSPYIVTDTIVVFPGNTLTIEPGVEVRFDNDKYLELRQASLIAVGNATDSITFTSNSGSPSAGSWGQIIQSGVGSHTCRFSYCNFRYATTGFFANGATLNSDSIFVSHSIFEYNSTGFHGKGNIEFVDSCSFFYNTMSGLNGAGELNHCVFAHNNSGAGIGNNKTIKNCVIDSNLTGLGLMSATATNCLLRNNQTGVEISGSSRIDSCIISNGQVGIYGNGTITNSIVDSNSIDGILLFMGSDTIVNCKIKFNGIGINDSLGGGCFITMNEIEENNIGIALATLYDTIFCNKICSNTLYDLQYLRADNTNCVANNYWCTNDSTILESRIYDGYDNISYGIVTFTPIDTMQCYLHTDVPFSENDNSAVTIFPNPTSNNFTVNINSVAKNLWLEIYTMLGEKIYMEELSATSKTFPANFPAGIYFIKVGDGTSYSTHKLVVE